MSLNNKSNVTKEQVSDTNDFMKMLETFSQYIRYRGLYASLALTFNSAREWLWFASHRKSSMNLTDLNTIEKDLDNKEHSTFYVPTPIIPFFKLIKSLQLPEAPVFIDYGAGKGRAMILAAECGFSKIKGLEFSPSLCEAGQKNIQSYITKTGKDCFELIHTDVLTYHVKEEDNFFYFFHPFNEHILKQCLDNIHLSLEAHPRKAFLIYQSNHKDNTGFFHKDKFFKFSKTFVSFGTRFYIYEYTP